ncbi:helix-turn-helix domain-containing protein [Synechococcus sp. PCC 7336]|uniref:helix-turn-helix domain-containing protein n=1 Tax=Synechococcus sp. PCC 7336 TaxID=195250 RepID=UPI0003643AAF|nr:helix-turn-helix domain-containing protein [Synechococcus sp. PCC 7336]
MNPIDIKAELRKAGYTQTDVAQLLNCTPQTVWNVISRRDRSRRVEEKIAELIDRPLWEVWPDSYPQAPKE